MTSDNEQPYVTVGARNRKGEWVNPAAPPPSPQPEVTEDPIDVLLKRARDKYLSR